MTTTTGLERPADTAHHTPDTSDHEDSAAVSYGTRPVRRRATAEEMGERRQALVDLAHEHGPCSVRHLFYASVVEGVAGVEKTEAGYRKVQSLVLQLRQQRRIGYELIVDGTRLRRKPRTFDSVEEALTHTARLYRRNLWSQSPYLVEVWCESDSIASTVADVTDRADVPLMVCRGHTSETFAWTSAREWNDQYRRQPVVLYIGDHDPAGLDIEESLRTKLDGFYEQYHDVIWRRIGVTWDQVVFGDLPGTEPKVGNRKRPYPYSLSVEAEAIPAPELRGLLTDAIDEYVDLDQLDVLRRVEIQESQLLRKLAQRRTVAP